MPDEVRDRTTGLFDAALQLEPSQRSAFLDLLYKQTHEDPVPPREVNPYIPDYLDGAIRKCLKKDPQDRFQSVHELMTALTKTGPSAVPDGTPLPRHLAASRRSDVLSLALGAVGLAVFIMQVGQTVPEAGLRIRLTKEQFLEEAKKELAGRGQLPTALTLHVDRMVYPADGIDTTLNDFAETNPYDFLAEKPEHAIRRDQIIREFPPYFYHVDSVRPSAGEEEGVLFEPTGAIRMVVLPIVGSVADGVDTSELQASELIRQDILRTFGTDPSKLEVQAAGLAKDENRKGYSFSWLKRHPSGVRTWYAGHAFDRVVDLSRWDQPPEAYHPPNKTYYGDRYDARIAWLVLLAVSLLFVTRRSHEIQMAGVLVPAAIGLTWGLFTPLSSGGSATGAPQLDTALAFGVIGMFGFVLLSYAVILLAKGAWQHVTHDYVAASSLLYFR